jgi:hypothetical protein
MFMTVHGPVPLQREWAHREGRRAGFGEGTDLGRTKGFEIGSEIGFYTGFCEVHLSLLCYMQYYTIEAGTTPEQLTASSGAKPGYALSWHPDEQTCVHRPHSLAMQAIRERQLPEGESFQRVEKQLAAMEELTRLFPLDDPKESNAQAYLQRKRVA